MVHNPKEIHKAVAKGTLSLVRSALLATGTATSKMSGTLSKGLAALSMDEEFIRRRAQRMAGSQRPQTISENLLDGARNLGLSVAEGASGLVVAPVVGARRDGVKGALVGVAQGVVGVAVKPAAGVLDLAARSAQRRSASVVCVAPTRCSSSCSRQLSRRWTRCRRSRSRLQSTAISST